jgi:hypothetical protein
MIPHFGLVGLKRKHAASQVLNELDSDQARVLLPIIFHAMDLLKDTIT